MADAAVILGIDKYTGGEMAVEEQQIDDVFIRLRERVFQNVNHKCISLQGASLDTGKDIIYHC